MTGFHIHGTDGEFGSVCDLILDDETWKVLCLVVEIQRSKGGKKVLIPLGHLLEMRWGDAELYLDQTIADMDKSKVFEEERFADPPLASNPD
jgi:hypothetical protein